jgi:hypothetical protein
MSRGQSKYVATEPAVSILVGAAPLDRELLRARFRDPIATFAFRLFGELGLFL